MEPVFWFQFRTHRRRKPWRVQFVDALPNDQGGVTDVYKKTISMLASLSRKRREELLGHEFAHALCAHVKQEDDEDHRHEERIAETVEASFIPFLRSLGVRLPPLPRGYREIRRAALARERAST